MQLKKTSPVHIKDDGSGYEREYTHGNVAIDQVDVEKINIAGVTVEDNGDEIVYQYREEPEVFIRKDGAYTSEDDPMRNRRRQAYFALSVLAGQGWVSKWRSV